MTDSNPDTFTKSIQLQQAYQADLLTLKICWSIVGVVCVPNIVALILRRNHVLVQKRNFWSVLVQILCILFFSMSTASDVLFGGKCWVSTGVAAMFLDLNLVLIIERSLGLIVEFSFSEEARSRFKHFENNVDDQPPEGRESRPSIFEEGHTRTRSRAVGEFDLSAIKWRNFFHSTTGYSFSNSKISALLIGILVSLPPFIIFAFHTDVAVQNVHEINSCQEISNYVVAYQLSMASASIVISCLCMRKFRGVEDNFFIKRELSGLVGTMFIKWLYLVVSLASHNVGQLINNVFAFLLVILIPVCDTLASVTAILILSRKRRKGNNSEMSNMTNRKSEELNEEEKIKAVAISQEVLHFLFEDDDAAKVFEQFLIKDLAVENILFYRAVIVFEKSCKDSANGQLVRGTTSVDELIFEDHKVDPKEVTQGHPKMSKIARVAASIYNEYVSPTAIMCINISGPCRSKLTRFFKELISKAENGTRETVPENIFTEAKDEIFLLTWYDSYARFRTTPEFAALQRSRRSKFVDLHEQMMSTRKMDLARLNVSIPEAGATTTTTLGVVSPATVEVL